MHDDQERGLEGEEEDGGRKGGLSSYPTLPTCTHENVVYMCTSLIGKLVPSRHLDISFTADTVVCTWTCESTNEYGVFGISRSWLTLAFSIMGHTIA